MSTMTVVPTFLNFVFMGVSLWSSPPLPSAAFTARFSPGGVRRATACGGFAQQGLCPRPKARKGGQSRGRCVEAAHRFYKSRRAGVDSFNAGEQARGALDLLAAVHARGSELARRNGTRYHGSVIRSFRDKDARRLFERRALRRLDPGLQRIALRKLRQLDAAVTLEDLRVPPGNRLERLRGDRAGEWSIRINEKWRSCFRWAEGDAHDVEIVDYH